MDGVEVIKIMKLRLGCVMYVGVGLESKELLLDLGVWGVMVVIKGLLDGMSS